MILVNQLKLPVNHTEEDIKNKIIKELNLRRIFKNMPSFEIEIIRRSIDARKKPEIFYVYSVAADFKDCDTEEAILKSRKASKYEPVIYKPRTTVKNKPVKPPVIIGEGPAGLFAGLILAYAGCCPVIIERGDKVDKRVEKVKNFWLTGSVDENTNVQFGEGGAGTFSDGKLNTLVKDKTGKNRYVLETFVKFGAKPECLYDAKPHVGTDVLEGVVKGMRDEIEAHGGRVLNLCKLTEVVISDNRIKSIIVENCREHHKADNTTIESVDYTAHKNSDEYNDSFKNIIKNVFGDNAVIENNRAVINADDVILATGHSARDTFKMLYEKDVNMEQKNFAVGIRIQHPQSVIDDSQYGRGHSDKLPPSPYKLTNTTSEGRSVFSFCMCPGGYVVNASSLPGHVCVNGMSYEDRASGVANSALIAAVDKTDFGSDDVLAGMYMQEVLETKAYKTGDGKIPVQLFKDYKDNKVSTEYGAVKPMFKGEVSFANIRDIFPDAINRAIIESINKFGYTIEGFDDGDAVIAAVESRTSSPVRILRDESLQSNIKGLYPCGEGAGYAGGIMSAAMDGIRVADALLDKYSE